MAVCNVLLGTIIVSKLVYLLVSHTIVTAAGTHSSVLSITKDYRKHGILMPPVDDVADGKVSRMGLHIHQISFYRHCLTEIS